MKRPIEKNYVSEAEGAKGEGYQDGLMKGRRL